MTMGATTCSAPLLRGTEMKQTMSELAEQRSKAYYRDLVVQLLGIKDPKLLERLGGVGLGQS